MKGPGPGPLLSRPGLYLLLQDAVSDSCFAVERLWLHWATPCVSGVRAGLSLLFNVVCGLASPKSSRWTEKCSCAEHFVIVPWQLGAHTEILKKTRTSIKSPPLGICSQQLFTIPSRFCFFRCLLYRELAWRRHRVKLAVFSPSTPQHKRHIHNSRISEKENKRGERHLEISAPCRGYRNVFLWPDHHLNWK